LGEIEAEPARQLDRLTEALIEALRRPRREPHK
jgi:hypothetical protein